MLQWRRLVIHLFLWAAVMEYPLGYWHIRSSMIHCSLYTGRLMQVDINTKKYAHQPPVPSPSKWRVGPLNSSERAREKLEGGGSENSFQGWLFVFWPGGLDTADKWSSQSGQCRAILKIYLFLSENNISSFRGRRRMISDDDDMNIIIIIDLEQAGQTDGGWAC